MFFLKRLISLIFLQKLFYIKPAVWAFFIRFKPIYLTFLCKFLNTKEQCIYHEIYGHTAIF